MTSNVIQKSWEDFKETTTFQDVRLWSQSRDLVESQLWRCFATGFVAGVDHSRNVVENVWAKEQRYNLLTGVALGVAVSYLWSII